MKAYRITRKQFVKDLSGVGAQRHGGRWNNRGTPMVYASESRALAAVEVLVHVSLERVPQDLFIAELYIPARAKVEQVDVADLPRNWRDYPAPPTLALIGSEWVRSLRSLVLRVPSAVVDREFNILLNPLHPQIKQVRVSSYEPFIFDQRLVAKRV